MMRRYLLLVLLLAGLVLTPAPAHVLAGTTSRPARQTAPCYLAAMQALTRQGALYSQGGHLPQDPIDPATGSYYPRTGPNSFDCSGLVWWSYAQAGVSIGSTTYQQLNDGVPIDCTLDDLHGSSTTCWTLGDLVFLRYSEGQHVAIYVGAGLFMDCYNYATGCILHDVTTDPFYAAHFYQARRIVSGCEGLTNNPGTPTNPSSGSTADLESLPDLVAYIALVVPQCGQCNPDGSLILPLQEQEPPLFDWNPLYPFRWLGTMIQNLVVKIICWLLTLLQMLANLLAIIVNAFIYAINSIWKTTIFVWLSFRSWLYGSWNLFEELRALFGSIDYVGKIINAWIQAFYPILMYAVSIIGQAGLLILHIVLSVIDIIGWIGGLGISLISEIIIALGGTNTPPPLLTNNHVVYQAVRGTLEGLQDSVVGWLFYLMYAMAYISFVVWLSRFLSQSKDT